MEKETLHKLASAGLSQREIAAELGCSQTNVKYWLKKHGLHTAKKRVDSKTRFMRAIEAEPNTGCWLWTGAVQNSGYGFFKVNTKMVGAHRWSAENLAGLDIADKLVCHTCDNRLCVNPDHLFIGSHEDNMADMTDKDRQAKGEENGQAKLTEEDVLMIRSSSLSNAELGRMLGVSRVCVRDARIGKFWRHV